MFVITVTSNILMGVYTRVRSQGKRWKPHEWKGGKNRKKAYANPQPGKMKIST